MALEVGSVLARLGAHLDESGFDRFDRRFHKTRTEAEKGVTAKASVDTKQAEAGFTRYTRKVDEADKAHTRFLRGSLRLHEGMGRLLVGGAGLAGVALGFEGIKEAVVGSFEAFEKHDKLIRQTEAVLKSTGGAAGVTAEKVNELVKARERLSGQDQDTIRNGANVLLTFRNIRDEAGKNNDVFDHALGLTQDLATAMHMDLSSAALQVGKALNDPAKGMTRLQRIGVTFTQQQLDQAKAMEAAGNTAGAQRIILRELTKEFGGSAAAQVTWTDRLKSTWHDLQIQLGQALAPTIEKGEKWLGRFLQQIRDNTGAGGRFREEVKKVGHELGVLAGDAKDVVVWLDRHKGLLKDLIGAYATYRGAVLLAAGATKTKGLVSLFTGLGKRQAEVAGAEAGAAYGGALLPAITAYVVAKGSVAIFRAIKRLEHFDNTNVTLDQVKATAPGSRAEADHLLTGYHAVTGVKATGTPAAPGPAFPALRSGDVELVTRYADQIERVAATGRRRDVLKVANDLYSAAAASGDPHKAEVLQNMAGAVTRIASQGNASGVRAMARALEQAGGNAPGLKHVVDGLLGIKDQAPHARKGANDVAGAVHSLDQRSDAYHSTASRLRAAQGSLNTALGDARQAGRRGAQGLDAIAASASDAVGAVEDAASAIASDVQGLAHSLGLKGIRFTVAKTSSGQRRQSHTFGSLPGLGSDLGVPGHAVGGVPNPSAGSRDDHLLIGPDGTPVAAMSGSEGILNTPQMGIVDTSLAIAKALGVQPYGGLGELWASGLRHYASGGILERANSLDRMHLPYVWGGHHGDPLIADPRPGLDCSSAVSYVLGIPPRVSGAFENFGSPGPGPITIYANPEHVFMSILGRGFGTSHENPAGGPGWLSYNSRPGFVVRHVDGDVGLGSVTAPHIAGPAGALRSVAQGAAGRVAAMANTVVTRALGALDVAGGQPLREGGLSKAQLAALWRRANGREGDPNLMAAIALAESAGIPSAANGPYHGLWQVGPGGPFDPLANAKAAGEKLRTQGLGAWQAFTNGHYRQFLGGGGLLRHFAGGGALGRKPPKPPSAHQLRMTAHKRAAAAHKHDVKTAKRTSSAAELGTGGAKAIEHLRALANDSSTEYDNWLADATKAQDDYTYLDRKFSIEGPASADLVNADTGEVDEQAVKTRAEELANLATVRANVIQAMVNARGVVRRIVRAYNAIIGRLERARGAIRGNRTYKHNRRAWYDGRIADYKGRVKEWQGKLSDLGGNLRDARLDWEETGKEYWAVLGTKGTAQTPPADPGATDPGLTDPGLTDPNAGATTDTSGAASASTAPSATDIAAAAFTELANLNAGRADLFSQYGANFMRADTLTGYAAGGAPDAQAAAGVRYFGAGASGTEGSALAAAGGQASPAVVQHITFTGPQPADPHTFTQAARHEAEAAFA